MTPHLWHSNTNPDQANLASPRKDPSLEELAFGTTTHFRPFSWTREGYFYFWISILSSPLPDIFDTCKFCFHTGRRKCIFCRQPPCAPHCGSSALHTESRRTKKYLFQIKFFAQKRQHKSGAVCDSGINYGHPVFLCTFFLGMNFYMCISRC